MGSRLREIGRGLASSVVLLVLLLGPPIALWAAVGWPLPEGIPTVDEFTTAARSGIDDAVIIKTLATLGWLAWLQIALAVLTEVVAVVRGLPAPSLPVMPGVQIGVGRLVASAALVFGSLAGPRTAPMLLPTPVHAAATQPLAESSLVSKAPPSASVQSTSDEWPEMSTVERIVERNDTWWEMAEQTLGDGMRWRDVRALNLGATMNDGTVITEATEHLIEGWVIRVPAAVVPDAVAVPQAPAAEVIVERGDNLWNLSEEHLEDVMARPASDAEIDPYWRQVVHANSPPIADPNVIHVGEVITMPGIGVPAPTVGQEAEAPTSEASVIDAPPPETEPNTSIPPPDQPATTTTTAPVPTTQAQPAATAPSRQPNDESTGLVDLDADDENGPEVPMPGLLGVAGATIAVGLSIELTRRRRRRAQQMPVRLPEPEPPEELDDLREETVRAADFDQVELLVAALGEVAASLAARKHGARARLVQLSSARLEVLLSEPVLPAPEGWLPEASGSAWALVEPAARPRVTETVTHPTLVSIGAPDDGQLFIDLEAEGLINVTGDPDDVAGFTRSLLLELSMSPLARTTSVIVCGEVDGVPGGTLERITHVNSWSEVADSALAWGHQTRQLLAANRWATPAVGRAVGDRADDLAPLIIVVPTEPDDERFSALCTLIGESVVPVVVVGVGAEMEGATQVHLTGGELRVPNLNLTCRAQVVSAEAGDQVEELLAESCRAPVLDNQTDDAGEQLPAVEENGVAPEPYRDAPFDILVRVLGEIDVVGGRKPLQPKQTAVIVHVTLHSPASTEQVQDAIWGHKAVDRRQRIADVMSQARGCLGAEHFPAATEGKYVAGPRVLTDLELFERRVEYAATRPTIEAVEVLRGAVEFVRGPAFTYRNGERHAYGWVSSENWISRTEMKVASAIVDLAEKYLELGDFDGAAWAAERGLSALPADPELTKLLIEAHCRAGDESTARKVFESHLVALDNLDIDEVDEDLVAAYEEMTGLHHDSCGSPPPSTAVTNQAPSSRSAGRNAAG